MAPESTKLLNEPVRTLDILSETLSFKTIDLGCSFTYTEFSAITQRWKHGQDNKKRFRQFEKLESHQASTVFTAWLWFSQYDFCSVRYA